MFNIFTVYFSPNEELNNLYSSPNVIRQIESMRTRWEGMWHAWEKSVQGFGEKAQNGETTWKTEA
jgi:hypothetical protein